MTTCFLDKAALRLSLEGCAEGPDEGGELVPGRTVRQRQGGSQSPHGVWHVCGGVGRVGAGREYTLALDRTGGETQAGWASRPRCSLFGFMACLLVFLLYSQRKGKPLRVCEAERPMNGFVYSPFQLTKFRFTVFMCILDANKKGFISLPLLIVQLIKSIIRTISRPESISTYGTALWGGRLS